MNRTRKPLCPVQIEATLTGGDESLAYDLCHGGAILEIVSGDETDRDETCYWTRFLFGSTSEPYAVELTKFGSHEKYVVTLADERCDCPDATYRPGRPGGCRHKVALRLTLTPLQTPVAA